MDAEIITPSGEIPTTQVIPTTRVAPTTDEALAGLDALESTARARTSVGRRALTAAWPRLLALVIAVGAWQVLVWSGWKPEFLLPGPRTVGRALTDLVGDLDFWRALATTLRRALAGFGLALVIGGLLGILVSASSVLRRAIGSLITGLQTMPSIAWFPLAILLFQLTETAILFVVVLGAAPSIANGVISGVDNIPPILTKVSDVLGARGIRRYRTIIIPAALPSIIGGLKQGWAFAWRSLVAGELLVILADRPSLGARLQFAREFSDAPGLLALMIVFLVIGLFVDAAFGAVDRRVRRRHGLA